MQDDPDIQRLEADLTRSQFEMWEVETFLADRHRAKIAALEHPRSKWGHRWRLLREVTDPAFLFVGWISALSFLTVWMLTGEYPLH